MYQQGRAGHAEKNKTGQLWKKSPLKHIEDKDISTFGIKPAQIVL